MSRGQRSAHHLFRWTVSGDTPARAAIVRQLQCVSPTGASCNVKRTISSTCQARIDGLRPRQGRLLEKSFSPVRCEPLAEPWTACDLALTFARNYRFMQVFLAVAP